MVNSTQDLALHRFMLEIRLEQIINGGWTQKTLLDDLHALQSQLRLYHYVLETSKTALINDPECKAYTGQTQVVFDRMLQEMEHNFSFIEELLGIISEIILAAS